jgi:GR25 family glycosyltransferase involved in LPS biosynthesis
VKRFEYTAESLLALPFSLLPFTRLALTVLKPCIIICSDSLSGLHYNQKEQQLSPYFKVDEVDENAAINALG